jgi:hypothetical protein
VEKGVGSIGEKVTCSERGEKIPGARGIGSVQDRWHVVRGGVDTQEMVCRENSHRGG